MKEEQMNTIPDQQPEVEVEKLAIEYNALREEIVKKIELRQQFVSITLAIAGVFFAIGVTTDTVILVYPMLVAFLAIGWSHNDSSIKGLATYIREEIEPKTPHLNWETHHHGKRIETRQKAWRFVLLSYGGIFIFTQLAAIALGLLQFQSTPVECALLVVDLVAVGLVLWAVVHAGWFLREVQE
jgi:hypothetical protein